MSWMQLLSPFIVVKYSQNIIVITVRNGLDNNLHSTILHVSGSLNLGWKQNTVLILFFLLTRSNQSILD